MERNELVQCEVPFNPVDQRIVLLLGHVADEDAAERELLDEPEYVAS
ncbi:hypothetical protein U9R90_00350 [Streptomyces sp. E11-3]